MKTFNIGLSSIGLSTVDEATKDLGYQSKYWVFFEKPSITDTITTFRALVDGLVDPGVLITKNMRELREMFACDEIRSTDLVIVIS